MNHTGINFLPRVFRFFALFSTFAMSTLHSQTFTEFSKVDVQQGFSAEEIESFIGDWENKEHQTKIIVDSIKPDGEAKVRVLSSGESAVKKAALERVAGIIPFLVIEMKTNEKVTELYNITFEGDKLVGSFEDLPNGKFVDLSFDRLPAEKPTEQYSNIDS